MTDPKDQGVDEVFAELDIDLGEVREAPPATAEVDSDKASALKGR